MGLGASRSPPYQTNEDGRPKRRCMNIRSACSPQGSVTLPATRRERLLITAHLAADMGGEVAASIASCTTPERSLCVGVEPAARGRATVGAAGGASLA